MREPVLDLKIADAERMRAFGACFARALTASAIERPLVLGLEGDLGAGKTTLVSGVLRALGASGPTRSPTYTLIEPYEFGELTVQHIDLYRLASPQELESLGLRDLLSGRTVLLIEWPSRGAGMLPTPDVSVQIDYPGTGQSEERAVRIRPNTENGDKLMRALLAEQPELSRLSP